MEIREAGKLGISAQIVNIDFAAIMERMRSTVKHSHDRIKDALEKTEDFDFYYGEARFVDDYTIEVSGEKIKGKTVFIATGARPLIPNIKGLDRAPYLTNETVLQLEEKPESMVIIGGGYIAAEFAHFFDAMGTKVTIIQRNRRLVPEEEPEVSALLARSLAERMEVFTNTEAIEIKKSSDGITVISRDRESGKEIFTTAQHLLIAAGRRSNADILRVENTGVKTDERGYIIVDEYLETTKKGIWAFGDAIGKKMFRHAANREAEIVWHNAIHEKKSKMNYLTVPHAVFSRPEIASVGLTEAEAIRLLGRAEVLVGVARYNEVARGEAMMETEAFSKAIVNRKTGRIIGYHIIGPQASVLVQEVVNAMAGGGDIMTLARGIHIHPALSEVVLKPFGRLRELSSSP